ncbi:MAG: phenylalanine--tRNA ligase subunit beta [Alphaproteobacteria bacterium RIFCSPHIGHO2_01_FULL_41_14]|nr:MAG: phenylalanine--tRNA ligase subunit beta [Alphaproteobacteria bacterium GWB1_45_5]OFW76093.1 MAG: phenylalanine--tRNA ligase subunit beta [Alphaproteobacteria bacterium GWA1_45_9]OFW90250.1 MAG: phenylalanine--tRNA ligase subunit beta [Alphaproteobacteria bacterium RIFCSPHIGHO2_01_FULL_41_14]HCI48288.1 phenylalanine--tRNA ligase subunit beta [Holosporales bacterium]
MKFTLSWLKDHLETSETLDQLIHRLTKLGLEVESVTNPAVNLKGFKVAHILEAKPHPEADRLQICTVDCGDATPLQIVCGAPNARRGLKSVLGLPGTHVPALNLTLKETKIRGVTSFGMLCSAKELGLEEGQDGIIELAEKAPVGAEFAPYAGLDDPVIEVSVTPNRPDCLGVRGIARDLAAAGAGTLKPLMIPEIPGSFKMDLKLTLSPEAQQACPQYLGRTIRGIKNRPSPEWLQKRLKAIGATPISALVDITNYVSFDLCRPLHVFDLRSIKRSVDIRLARQGEPFVALDEKEYVLEADMVVIADQEKVLALGGVMGGLDSGCTLETDSVLLESAYFNPLSVASTGRKLNIHSESRYRFERGVDPLLTRMGMERATQLILEICGGEVSDIIEVGEVVAPLPHIPFHVEMVTKRTGIKLPKDTAYKILENLGFTLLKDQHVAVPPSWRPDITLSVDVVEEVARIYGYEHLPEVSLPSEPPKTLFDVKRSEFFLRHLLASRSFMEVVTWSMVSKKQFRLFGGTDENLRIMNPITVDLEYLRPSVLIHLLKAVQQNLDRGLSPLSFFEIGPAYRTLPEERFMPDEISTIAGVRLGTQKAYHWSKQERETDVFDLKSDVVAILERSGVPLECVEFSSETPYLKDDKLRPRSLPSWYHPGRSAWINVPKGSIGVFGEIHPAILKEFGIRERVYAFELDLVGLDVARGSAKKVKSKGVFSLSPFQRVERDFCFLFNKSVKAERIMKTVRRIDPCVKEVQIFDLYEGTGVPAGFKSVSIHVTFEPQDHTFSDAEIKTLYDRVLEAVEADLQGSLRV